VTRRDYVKIAEVLRKARSRQYGTGGVRDQACADEALDEVTARLCEMLKLDNPRFDRGRFEHAAGGVDCVEDSD